MYWYRQRRRKRIGELARAVRGDDHERSRHGAHGAQFRNRHLKVRQQLEQVGFERLVGTVDFVDQQHRLLLATDRLEQRPFQQITLGEDVLLFDGGGRSSCSSSLIASNCRW